jgi:hypothetical protein
MVKIKNKIWTSPDLNNCQYNRLYDENENEKSYSGICFKFPMVEYSLSLAPWFLQFKLFARSAQDISSLLAQTILGSVQVQKIGSTFSSLRLTSAGPDQGFSSRYSQFTKHTML